MLIFLLASKQSWAVARTLGHAPAPPTLVTNVSFHPPPEMIFRMRVVRGHSRSPSAGENSVLELVCARVYVLCLVRLRLRLR
jgi:hypothetical protein